MPEYELNIELFEEAGVRSAHIVMHQHLAEILGDGWRFTVQTEKQGSGKHEYRVVSDNGQCISMKIDNRCRVIVSGSWPKAPNGDHVTANDVGEKEPTTTISFERGIDVISQDIKRRFLPAYIRIWDKIIAKIVADSDRERDGAEAWKSLLETGLIQNSSLEHSRRGWLKYGVSGRVEQNDNGFYGLEVKDNLSLEMLTRILTLLKIGR